MTLNYAPINCDFHDLLEVLATRHEVARIEFLDADNGTQNRTSEVVDVFSSEGAEYLLIGTGERLRLDRLLTVNGESLADYPTTEANDMPLGDRSKRSQARTEVPACGYGKAAAFAHRAAGWRLFSLE